MSRELSTTIMASLRQWRVSNEVPESALARLYRMLEQQASGRIAYLHADQRPKLYMPELKASAWHDIADFPWTEALHAESEAILAEHRTLKERAWLKKHPESNLLTEGSWKILPLFTHGAKNVDNCALLPHTTQMLEAIPTASRASLVYVSSLAPHTKVAPHCGPMNLRLRCHFGLSIPSDCHIRVGSETRTWQEGRCLIFDDSFEHSASNASDRQREVIIIDFWHPELTTIEQQALEFLFKRIAELGLMTER